ncbi:MAG TPA: hypothetical protein DCM86_11745 [Verrucomicrobiales bacterium]|nr:hypothetical protein [Verrucomicrobiales bacterium]
MRVGRRRSRLLKLMKRQKHNAEQIVKKLHEAYTVDAPGSDLDYLVTSDNSQKAMIRPRAFLYANGALAALALMFVIWHPQVPRWLLQQKARAAASAECARQGRRLLSVEVVEDFDGYWFVVLTNGTYVRDFSGPEGALRPAYHAIRMKEDGSHPMLQFNY